MEIFTVVMQIVCIVFLLVVYVVQIHYVLLCVITNVIYSYAKQYLSFLNGLHTIPLRSNGAHYVIRHLSMIN